MAFSSASGIGVGNWFGPRDTGGSVGVEHSENSISIYSIAFTGATLNGTFLPQVFLPKGAKFLRAYLRVDEAFALTGTTPLVYFGEEGAESTNGIVLSESELETIGTVIPVSDGIGTWDVASFTTASKAIGILTAGTNFAADAALGKATLIIEFFNKTKV